MLNHTVFPNVGALKVQMVWSTYLDNFIKYDIKTDFICCTSQKYLQPGDRSQRLRISKCIWCVQIKNSAESKHCKRNASAFATGWQYLARTSKEPSLCSMRAWWLSTKCNLHHTHSIAPRLVSELGKHVSNSGIMSGNSALYSRRIHAVSMFQKSENILPKEEVQSSSTQYMTTPSDFTSVATDAMWLYSTWWRLPTRCDSTVHDDAFWRDVTLQRWLPRSRKRDP